jgi:DNA-binding NtrC family response regulator
LADDLSGRDRRTYLSKKSYREARECLNQAATMTAALPSNATEMLDKEGSLFARLYRLAAAMTAATELSGAVAMLLQALKETINHPGVVVLGSHPKLEYHPIRLVPSEEVRKRITSVASSAWDRPYISGYGAGRKQVMVTWIPFLSVASPGGIYVESIPGDSFLNEREIEFLTIVAAISGAAFDHLSIKVVMPGTRPFLDLYGIVGSSNQIGNVRARIESASGNSASVLIEGESGTGKELVARAIHQQSSRSTGPFIAVDCGALPEGLIEAELFGAKRGAYTGAASDRQGLFEAAHQGTLFLDEIANLGIAAQAKLLRVLQEREIRMIGSTSGKTIDVRVIAATNCNLERLIRDGKFRQDLLYRLKVLHILLPPLRNRKDDIPVLAATFLERLNSSNQSRKYFGPRVMEEFMQHNFPGNVRELQNAVERAFYTSTGVVITDVDFFKETNSIDSPANNETESWFKDLSEGRENFGSNVHDRYKRRDISRERLVALVDFGLRTTGGRYKKMASMLQIPKDQYHRFMDFLRRSECLLDFRPYRKSDEASD